MNVLVCIKSVESEVDCDTSDYDINPYDLFALQYGVDRKAQFDFTITCLCMGPKKAKNVLKYCYALGADRAYLINDNVFAGSDTYATSYVIAKAINRLGNFDLIICGARTLDGETGQVPFAIAERLEMSSISNVLEITECKKDFIVVKREHRGYKEILRGETPSLLIFQQFAIDKPILSFMQMKKARSRVIHVLTNQELRLDVADCGLKGSLTQVLDSNRKFSMKKKNIINGSNEEKAVKLADLINKSIL